MKIFEISHPSSGMCTLKYLFQKFFLRNSGTIVSYVLKMHNHFCVNFIPIRLCDLDYIDVDTNFTIRILSNYRPFLSSINKFPFA